MHYHYPCLRHTWSPRHGSRRNPSLRQRRLRRRPRASRWRHFRPRRARPPPPSSTAGARLTLSPPSKRKCRMAAGPTANGNRRMRLVSHSPLSIYISIYLSLSVVEPYTLHISTGRTGRYTNDFRGRRPRDIHIILGNIPSIIAYHIQLTR